MTTYSFIDNILHVSLEGEVNINDLFSFLDDFEKIEDLPEHLKVFYDLRKAQLELKIDDINLLSKAAEEKTRKCKSVKTAFCVEDPKVTAYTMLFSWMPENSRIKREQFSTKQAALSWLQDND